MHPMSLAKRFKMRPREDNNKLLEALNFDYLKLTNGIFIEEEQRSTNDRLEHFVVQVH